MALDSNNVVMLGLNVRLIYFKFLIVHGSWPGDHCYVSALSLLIIKILQGDLIWVTLLRFCADD
jgi:hypothetical protein